MNPFVRVFISVFLLFFLPLITFSQDRTLDSLDRLIRTTSSDTVKVNTQIIICRSLWAAGKLDSAMIYAQAAKQLSEKIGFKKGQADAYNNVAIVYMYKSDYYRSEEFFLKAIERFQKLGNKKKTANVYNNLGEIYRLTGNFPKALKTQYTGLKIRDEIKDSAGMAMSNNNIAVIQEKQGNYKDALTNYFAALDYYKLKGSKSEIARTYNNIAEVFRSQKQYSKALEYQNLSLALKKEINDVVGLSMTYHNIGGIYNGMAKTAEGTLTDADVEKYYSLSLENFLSAKKIMDEIGDNYMIAFNLADIASIYVHQKKFKEAEELLERSLSISKATTSKVSIREALSGLAELYVAKGDYKKAYLNYVYSDLYEDTILNEENSKKTVEAQMQYAFDKKEAVTRAEQKQKDILTEQEKQNQRLVIYAVLFGLALVVVFSGFIYNRFKITNRQKKIIETKEQEAQKQNEVISLQKNIVEAKHKEITDSINYAERIQRALLASKKILDDNLKDHFILFQPKDIVSGDFYWAVKLNSGEFILATADSTGHGVPGAIMSILNISCLDKAITEGNTSPELILNETRKLIIENLKNDGSPEGGKDGMDGSLLKFDLTKNTLDCACANSPVWIIRDRTLIEIKPDRMPIGKHEKDQITFTKHSVALQKGDTVYCLTDGMADQFGGPNGKKFMQKQLKELFIEIGHKPMEIQKKILLDTLNNWRGELEQVDDVTIVGVRI